MQNKFLVSTLLIMFFWSPFARCQGHSESKNAAEWNDHQAKVMQDLLKYEVDVNEENLSNKFIVLKTERANDTLILSSSLLDKNMLSTMIYNMDSEELLGYNSYNNIVVLIVGKESSKENYEEIFPVSNLKEYKNAISKLNESVPDTLHGVRIWHLASIHQTIFVNEFYKDQLIDKRIIENGSIFN